MILDSTRTPAVVFRCLWHSTCFARSHGVFRFSLARRMGSAYINRGDCVRCLRRTPTPAVRDPQERESPDQRLR